MASLGRVQDVDRTVLGNILSSDAPIEVDVSPDLDIEVSNVKVHVTSTAVTGATFTIKNIYGKDLIAYSMLFNLYWDKYPDAPRQLRVNEDGWFLNQYVLHSGQTKQGIVRTSLSPTEPMKLTRVTVIPEYVEFSDGSVFGSNASLIGNKFAANRQIKVNLQQKYADQLQSGQSASSVASNIQTDQVSVDNSSQLAIGILRAVLNREGPQGLSKRLLEAPAPLTH